MSDISKRILDILSSDTNEVLNENQLMGGLTGFGQNQTDKPLLFKEKDAERKREEREEQRKKEKRLKEIQKTEKETGVSTHPREKLSNSPLRFTLKQAFLANLIQYLETNKSAYLNEAITLVNEYPKLKEWVQTESVKHLPSKPFSIYQISEWLNEDVGTEYSRPINKAATHVTWHLSESSVKHKKHLFTDSMILECQISPDKVLIYIPAFAKMMEELIFSGKIEEPIGNPILKAKQYQECVTESSIKTGLVTKIHKEGE